MGFSQGSTFGINGCKVADGGREDSNGCSPVFLYWEFRVRSLVIILSSAKHFNWGPGTTPLCLWLLYFAFIPLWFMLGSSVRYLRVCFMEIEELGCRLALEVGVFGHSM